MEFLSQFSMREWLIAAGLVLVLSVLIDGYRRMRSERRDNIKLSLGMGGGFDEDVQSSELPNGGARVIKRTDPIISDQGADDLFTTDPETSAESEHNQQDFDSSPVAVSEREIIVIHVRSNDADGFNGSDLLQVLIACDMRYGDRDILHRHEHAGGNGSLQFSLANMIEPGTFNIDDINNINIIDIDNTNTIQNIHHITNIRNNHDKIHIHTLDNMHSTHCSCRFITILGRGMV